MTAGPLEWHGSLGFLRGTKVACFFIVERLISSLLLDDVNRLRKR
jgi:hypothetical protein